MKEQTIQRAFYTIREFAALMGVHYNTVRRAIKTGQIQAFKIGLSKYRIPHSEAERMAVFDLRKLVKKLIQEETGEK